MVEDAHVHEGQRVGPGEPIASLETTKSTQDFESPASGYIAGLRLEAGQTVRAGEILCYLAEDPAWKPDPPEASPAEAAAVEVAAPAAEGEIAQ